MKMPLLFLSFFKGVYFMKKFIFSVLLVEIVFGLLICTTVVGDSAYEHELVLYFEEEPETEEENPDMVLYESEKMFEETEEESEAEPDEEAIKLRYGFDEDEIFLLAQLIAGDKDRAGDGEYDFTWDILNGKPADRYEIGKILCVVMNRVKSDIYPDTVAEVLMQKGQFVVFPRNLKADPHPLAIDEIRDWCGMYDIWDEGAQVIPEDHLFFSAGPGLTNTTRARYR